MHQFLDTITPQFRDIDAKEYQQIAWYAREGCKCEFGPKKTPCCQQFPEEYYREVRGNCHELKREEKDVLMMGMITAMTNTSKQVSTENRHKDTDRQRIRGTYFHQAKRVCLRTFLFLHATGKDQFANIRASCSENGIAPRVHGNTRRLPVHALTFDDVSRVVTFIRNYAEDHAVLLPGRIPGYKRSDLQLLPCSTTKSRVWKLYTNACELSHNRQVAYSSFCNIWRTPLPMIVPAKPRTDLCGECHAKAGLLMRSSNLTEGEKTEVNKQSCFTYY